jgi:serine/threonine protein phosphatase PrpC
MTFAGSYRCVYFFFVFATCYDSTDRCPSFGWGFVPVVVNHQKWQQLQHLNQNNRCNYYDFQNRQHFRSGSRTHSLYMTSVNNISDDHQETNYHDKNGIQWEFGHATFAGSDPDRPNKINQDASFFSPSIHRNDQTVQSITTAFGVMDGHGRKGHEVVSYLQQQLPIRIHEYINRTIQQSRQPQQPNDDRMITARLNGIQPLIEKHDFSLDEQKLELITIGHADPAELYYHDTTKSDIHPDNLDCSLQMERAIVDAFVHCQYDLRQNPDVPSSRSGTTCTCCILVENQNGDAATLYIANVGDSRAILITSSKGSDGYAWNVKALTNTTTVNVPKEQYRIESCDGRIDTSGNVFFGPIGISMTRSLGNSVMLRAGVLPIPIITKEELCIRNDRDLPNNDPIDYYVCAGTDGVFDVLSNEQVMRMIQEGSERAVSLNDIAAQICNQAKLAWLADLPIETKVDDCTITILHFSTNQ